MAAVDDGGLQGEKNGSSGWQQLGASVVGSGDGWQQLMVVGYKVKNFQIFFCTKGAKKPKNNMSFFVFTHIWGVDGWVRISLVIH